MLIINTLFYIISSEKANCQISNQLAFEDAFEQVLQKISIPFGKTDGFTTEKISSLLVPDTTASDVFLLDTPDVKFSSLKGPYFKREIVSLLTVGNDSVSQELKIQVTDTLHRKELRMARRSSIKELRGENPRILFRTVLPATAIVSGIAVIISLFYIRST